MQNKHFALRIVDALCIIAGFLGGASVSQAQECEGLLDCVPIDGLCSQMHGFPECSDDPCAVCCCDDATVKRCKWYDGVSCDDGNSCTGPDHCEGGSCMSGPGCTPDPENPCTLSLCLNPNGGSCQHPPAPAGSPCDDGNFCNGPDQCNGIDGRCQPTPSPDDDPCPGDFCEATCDELLEQCRPPLPCDDNNACTRDWCAPSVGCRHEDLVCNDQNACNGTEWCDPQTGCRSEPPLDCDDDNSCTDDWCDATSGCYHSNNTRPCDDGDACTTNDQCQGGYCVGGPPRVCNDNNACNGVETCDPDTGCVDGTPRDCDDGPPCVVGRCEPALGECVYECVPEPLPLPPRLIPEADDRTFVYVHDEELSAGETFITSQLKVTRYAGETNPVGGGPLVHAAALKTDGLAKDARLTIVAWGVQAGSSHAVYFNGVDRGDLRPSSDCTWSSTTFTIPLEQVNFPGERPPIAEPNEVKIVVGGTPMCLRFRAAILAVKLMSPIILIHGNNSDGAFFVRRGFTASLNASHLVWDRSINLPTAPRALNAKRLSHNPDGSDIPEIVHSFGADSVHLVAHSKGGLDTREYLETHYKRRICVGGTNEGQFCDTDAACPGEGATCTEGFKILSLTTLSTPHNGTVLADIGVSRLAAVTAGDAVYFAEEFPLFTELVAWLDGRSPPDTGRPDLQTTTCGLFNSANIPYLSRFVGTMSFNAVGADADLNGNGQIDSVPDEYAELRGENPDLANAYSTYGALATTEVVDVFYQILRDIPTVAILRTQMVVGMILSDVAVIQEPPNSEPPKPNDTLVTVASALGTGTYSQLILPFISHSVALPRATPPPPIAGRNHASIADVGIANLVIPWLRESELDFGDLR